MSTVLKTTFVLVLTGLIGVGLPFNAEADDRTNDVRIEQVEVGIGGYFKVGHWAPLAVTVDTTRSARVELVVEAPDPNGSRTILPAASADLPSAGVHRIEGRFLSGRLGGTIRIRIEEEGRLLAERQVRLSRNDSESAARGLRQSTMLVASLGHPAGLSALSGVSPDADSDEEALDIPDPTARIRVVDLDSPEQLPQHPDGYAALDVLIISGQYQLGADRSHAVRDWVRSGGHVIVSVGEEVDAYLESPLSDWIPVPVTGQVMVRELSGVESLAGQHTRIVIRGRSRTTPAAKIGTVAGQQLVSGLDGPLMVRTVYGFGRVTFSGIDFNRPPLSEWEGMPAVYLRLLDAVREDPRDRKRPQQNRLTHTGITDLATQLHAIQEHFPEVRRLSSWWVMGLMLLYLLIIGPLDYLFVHRVLKRPRLTWLTFPSLVLAAGLLAAWGAEQTNGREVHVNQLDIVDIDGALNRVRGTSWMTVYTPETRRYEVTFDPVFPTSGHRSPMEVSEEASVETDSVGAKTSGHLTWTGIPESTFGGLYREGGVELGRPSYRYLPGAAGIENLPTFIWSTKNLKADWEQSGPPLVESTLESSGVGHLTGTITHHLPAPLTDWMLAYGSRVYRPAVSERNPQGMALSPGQIWSPSAANVFQRELKGYLTRTTATRVNDRKGAAGEKILIEQTAYDPLHRDPDELIRMLTFHRAAGGKNYTGLSNQSLKTFDFSDMLHLNRAVLFGRMEWPATHFEFNGEEVAPARRFSYVRILLPVKPIEGARPEMFDWRPDSFGSPPE